MTAHQEDEPTTLRSNLLTPQEQAICKRIATSKAPHSQRALALLTLNENSTQVHAADQAGLSLRQVGYWLAKFRKLGLGIFPDTLLEELRSAAITELETEIVEEPEPVAEEADSAEDKTMAMRAGKKKAKKETIEAKKDKKGKKDRKGKKNKEGRRDRKGKKNKKTRKAKRDEKGKEAKRPRRKKKA